MKTTYHTKIRSAQITMGGVAQSTIWVQDYPNVRLEISYKAKSETEAKQKLINFISLEGAQKIVEIEEDLALNSAITTVNAEIIIEESNYKSNAKTLANITIDKT